MVDFYKLLEIGTNDREVVERAFRKLSLLCHPDKPGGSAEKFGLLAVAKNTLLTTPFGYDCKLTSYYIRLEKWQNWWTEPRCKLACQPLFSTLHKNHSQPAID